jgi:hypothetical protein
MNYFERKLPGIDQIHSRVPRTMEAFAQDELGRYDFDSILDAYNSLPPEDFITATKAERWVRRFSDDTKPTMQEIASHFPVDIVRRRGNVSAGVANLVPFGGRYTLFLNNHLPDNEVQFSIAHELGHIYLKDWLKLDTRYTCIWFDKQEALCELIALYFLRQHLLQDGRLPSLADISRTFDGEEYSLDWAVDLAMLHGYLPRTILFEVGTNHCFNCRYESPCFGEAVSPEHYQKIPKDIKEGGKWTSPCEFINSSSNMPELDNGRSFI